MIPPLADSFLGSDLIGPLSGISSILAFLGIALILPIYISHRREVERLLDWQERHPEAGDDGSPDPDPAAAVTALRGRPMSVAERVTSERPALARIGTAERAAIELEHAPFWKRVVVRGPRHPLVLSLLALLLAAGVFAAAVLLIDAGDDDAPSSTTIDRSSFEVVVLNASPFPNLANNVAEDIEAASFVVSETTASGDTVEKSTVRYAPGFEREAKAVALALGRGIGIAEFDSAAEAAADGAAVVVVVGADLAEGEEALNEESSGKSDRE